MSDPAPAPAAGRPARRARVRRERSLVETLLSIVLGLEAVMLVFAALVFFGLARFDPNWLAFVYGGIGIVVYAAVSGVQRWTWGVWLGAALQLPLIAAGLIEPLMFLVGAGFAAMWVYCYLRGRQIDTQKAAWLAAHRQTETETDTPAPNEGETA
ncbi:DUF4233 domain-containing protein [Protaetiibacter larvae]|uniref:DUF4233 domain-containing protein n=1 Tax=Protaetiibacter larvae TaxID=2592654 RepID=A0A5C1Y903_9MICO|nr:DUF4233 domain-containing protein [Protaetiibacter larvae]QEO09725.1 DUF4233 domain-containing protein [Protaetiibacter larvae]